MDISQMLMHNDHAGSNAHSQAGPQPQIYGIGYNNVPHFITPPSRPFPPMPAPQDPGGGFAAPAEQNIAESDEAKAKKSRKRQQTSCSECHRRKQKCNKEVPCDRCIKRGTADQCRILPASVGEGSPEPSPPISTSEPKKRKRTRDETEDLAARVQQLETLIRVQAGLVKKEAVAEEDETNSEQSAVEEAAVAALGQLSKAIPNEGGSEARIYSGPGSVSAFINAASGGGRGNDLSVPRARVADMRLYNTSSIYNAVNAPMRLTRLADALQEQKTKFPPAPVCHYLFDMYYRIPVFAEMGRAYPRGCIQLCYDALFEEKDMSEGAQAARAQNFPQLASPASLAFVSLVFIMLACSLSMSPDQTPETHQLASAMYEASRSAFMASERREQPTYAVIRALNGQAGWLKLAGCPSLGFTYIAQAIRFGQSMGLHREPGPKWGLNPFESEVRRRIWLQLFCMDRGHSLAYGRPYIISEQHCDVELPANINDCDLTADGPTNIRPDGEVTEFTSSLISIAIARTMAEIIDKAFSCKPPTYKTVLELDNLVNNAEQQAVPNGLRNPSVTEMMEKPYVKDQYVHVQIQCAWLRSLLHRPYLLLPIPKPGAADHYAGSRAAAVMLSQRMLVLCKDVLDRTPYHYQGYFSYAFHCFEPAVTLAMAITQDPGRNANLDKYVRDGIAMLESMAGINKVAQEGLDSLHFMRERYLPLIGSPPSLTLSSTSTSASRSSGDPSPVTNNTPPMSLAPPLTGAGNAPTPNTLFDQFFKDYASPLDNGVWMEDPAPLEEWPIGYARLEGETDFGDWKKMLGL